MGHRDILSLMKSMLNDLPKAEKRIAKKIIEHPEKVIKMTASDLGKFAGSSAATVIRLTQRLKIDSFTELKVLISRFITSEDRVAYSDITAGELTTEIMDKLYWNSALAMKDTISILSEDAIAEANDTIRDASVIYTFGIGASSLGAKNIAQKWSRVGKTCIHIEDSHVLISALVGSEAKTVLITVSNSGETHELVKLSEIAQRHGHKTISITRFGNNSLTKKSDISLQHVRTNEIETRSAATSSLHAQFLVIDVLFYSYLSKNFDQAVDKIRDSHSTILEYNNEMQDNDK